MKLKTSKRKIVLVNKPTTIDTLLPFRLLSLKTLLEKIKNLRKSEINDKLLNRIYDYLNIINQKRIDEKIRNSFKKKGKIRERHRRKYLKLWVKRKTR